MTKRVLVVGSGGREHAVVDALARSPQQPQLWCAPGNPGIARHATRVSIAADDVEAIARWARDNAIDLVVVGPEQPLVDGLVDRCTDLGIAAFGPTAAAARIESSKAFAKDIMSTAGVRTAASATFDDVDAALAHVAAFDQPPVVKADGLAAGKGVVVASDHEEARAAVRDMLEAGSFGDAGRRIVLEERLDGPELSVLALVSGTQVRALLPARDHKRAHEHDRGPNTGGMGAFAPVPDVDDALLERIHRDVLQPVVNELARRGTPFTGVLFAGLMLTDDGPAVIEFNARLGDPETQVVLPLLETDLLDVLEAAVEHRLDALQLQWRDVSAVTVVVAAPGYPESPRVGQIVTTLPEDASDMRVFHAGTAERDGQLCVAGGRVLAATAMAPTLDAARQRALDLAREVAFDGAWLRTDIAAVSVPSV